jgi:hypothetical protein
MELGQGNGAIKMTFKLGEMTKKKSGSKKKVGSNKAKVCNPVAPDRYLTCRSGHSTPTHTHTPTVVCALPASSIYTWIIHLPHPISHPV